MTKFPKVVVGAIVYNGKDEIFVAKSYKLKNKWTIPGGHVEYGESLEDAVRREVKEETNLDVKNIEFIDVQESIFSKEFHKKKHFIFIDFCCYATSSKVKLNDEFQEYKWVAQEKSLEMPLNSSAKKLIQDFINKK